MPTEGRGVKGFCSYLFCIKENKGRSEETGRRLKIIDKKHRAVFKSEIFSGVVHYAIGGLTEHKFEKSNREERSKRQRTRHNSSCIISTNSTVILRKDQEAFENQTEVGF
ncbi:7255_t:CDS:2 [Ambispora gerdemannii]|uniref:7255_t:CDS:1 n=1 Tax=Ambispora gerdemannii TaxID=144530 RepID=A0A9N9D6K7_9GLOM|nr:7255_t:CDS:2 [Ambispora gerdemannii]